MKSKFFGLNAKLALAVLAVGTMFTGCYDSENGDVTQPYQAPDAVYTFTGTVTSEVTGKGVGQATVEFSGAVTDSVETDETGTYQYSTTKINAGQTTVTLKVSGNDFEEKTVQITDFNTVNKGQSIIYFKNVRVAMTVFEEDGLDFESSLGVSGDDGLDDDISGDPSNPNYKEEYGVIDLVNNSGAPQSYDITFKVKKGSKVEEDTDDIYGFGTRALADDLKEAIKARIRDILGTEPTPDYTTRDLTETLYLQSGYALGSVSFEYDVQTYNFDYTYNEEPGRVQVKVIEKVTITMNVIPAEFYHGTGHGHGHGDNENAGGGIVVPEL